MSDIPVELDEVIDCHEAHSYGKCWDSPQCCHAVIESLRQERDALREVADDAERIVGILETDRPIAELLPNVTAHIDSTEIVLDGMVLMRVIDPSGGHPRLCIAVTPDLDWMLQVGMLQVAREICTADVAGYEPGDDE